MPINTKSDPRWAKNLWRVVAHWLTGECRPTPGISGPDGTLDQGRALGIRPEPPLQSQEGNWIRLNLYE
jgi:hypothetical protein